MTQFDMIRVNKIEHSQGNRYNLERGGIHAFF